MTNDSLDKKQTDFIIPFFLNGIISRQNLNLTKYNFIIQHYHHQHKIISKKAITVKKNPLRLY